jgi:hypothetical protein
MRVAHAAVFSYGQTFASGLKFRQALLLAFARLQALGCGFVGSGHGTVARHIFLDFFVAVLCKGHRRQQGGDQNGSPSRKFHDYLTDKSV